MGTVVRPDCAGAAICLSVNPANRTKGRSWPDGGSGRQPLGQRRPIVVQAAPEVVDQVGGILQADV